MYAWGKTSTKTTIRETTIVRPYMKTSSFEYNELRKIYVSSAWCVRVGVRQDKKQKVNTRRKENEYNAPQ
jgi:hypothetical protein